LELEDRPIADTDRRRTLATLAAIIAIGAVIRLTALGRQSFWLDEAFSVTLARAPWGAFVYQLRTTEANMGVYHLLLRPWESVGTDESHIRLLSVLAGIATIPVTAAVARRLFGRAVALTAAAVIALDPLDIWASQEARGYALVILLVTCSTWAFVRAVGGDPDAEATGVVSRGPWADQSGAWWTLYVVASALAVYTHLYATFVLFAQWLSLAVRPRSIRWRPLLASGIALAVLLAPMMLFVVSGPHGNIDWIRGVLTQRPSAIWQLIQSTLGIGGAIAAFGYVVACGVVTWTGARMTRRAATPQSRWAALLPVAWLVTPVAIPLAVSVTLKPVLDPRYITICAPAVAILTAAAIAQSRGPWRMRLLALVVAFELFGDWAYFAGFRKENWREASLGVLADARAGDLAIFYAPYVRRPFDYYAAHRTPAPTGASRPPRILYPSARYSDFTLDSVLPLSLAGALDSARLAPRLWLILSHMAPGDSSCIAVMDAVLRPRLHPSDDRHLAGGIEVRLYVRAGGLSDVGQPAVAAAAIAGACRQE
jgi:mannosyltransferase